MLFQGYAKAASLPTHQSCAEQFRVDLFPSEVTVVTALVDDDKDTDELSRPTELQVSVVRNAK